MDRQVAVCLVVQTGGDRVAEAVTGFGPRLMAAHSVSVEGRR